MSDAEALDKTFHFIMKQMVNTGVATHYTEIAVDLGVSPEEGRKTMKSYFGKLTENVFNNDKIGLYLKS